MALGDAGGLSPASLLVRGKRMSKSYAIFAGLFLVALALFILGAVTGSLPLVAIAFVATLVLFAVRRSFLQPR